jgi:hypothetical protein
VRSLPWVRVTRYAFPPNAFPYFQTAEDWSLSGCSRGRVTISEAGTRKPPA